MINAYTMKHCTELCPRREKPEVTCDLCRALDEADKFVSWLLLKPLWRKFCLKKALWIIWHYSGTREICALMEPRWKAATDPKPSTFLLWVIGIYIALFGLASQRFESRLDQIENRANGIYAQLGTTYAKRALSRIPRAQQMTRPSKPELFVPWSVWRSLVSQPERDSETVRALIEVVETFQDLVGVNLSEIDLNDAHLSNADFSNATLSMADLNNATLRNTDLSEASLGGANLSEAHLYISKVTGDFREITQHPYIA